MRQEGVDDCDKASSSVADALPRRSTSSLDHRIAVVPISRHYASTIVEVRASFILSGFRDSPDRITDLLGLQPDSTTTRGSTDRLGNIAVPFSENSWRILSNSHSKDVNEQIRDLLTRLSGKDLIVRAEWHPAFDILWKGNYLHAGSGPYYEADVLAGISTFRAALLQDIYQVNDVSA